MRRRMHKLSVDFEHNSRRWWDAGGQALWDGIVEEPGASSVVLDDDLAQSWLVQARCIPGWDEGPEFAPHPIAARPLADDDPELG
jgi:hypothetical protein